MCSDQPWSSNLSSSAENLAPSHLTKQMHGSICLTKQALPICTVTFLTAFVLASTSNYPPFYPHKLLLTDPPSLNLTPNYWRLYRQSLAKGTTLAHSPEPLLSHSLVPSKLPHLPSSQNQPKLASSTYCRIFGSSTIHLSLIPTHQLIHSSTPTIFPPPGEPFLSPASCSINSHWALRSPPGMFPKCTRLSLCICLSGLQWSLVSMRTDSPLTLLCALVYHPLPVHTGKSTRPAQIFYITMRLAHCQDGLTITYSLASHANTLMNTTSNIVYRPKILQIEEHTNMGTKFGTEDTSLVMTPWKNLMKIASSHVMISLTPHHTQWKTKLSPITSATSIKSPIYWVSLGTALKTNNSAMRQPTLVSSGTYAHYRYHWVHPKR